MAVKKINGAEQVTIAVQILSGVSSPLSGSSLAGGASESTTATVSGAVVGSPVAASANDGSFPPSGVAEVARVTASNTVTVQRTNVTLAPITTSTKTYNVRVLV